MRRAIVVLLCALSALGGAAGAAREQSTPQQVFEAMRQGFRPEKARAVHARYQFDITGEQGGSWWIEVNDGKCKMGEGRIEHPDVTLTASDKDWVALANDKLSGAWASITGRLKIRGDRALARKLDEMFP
jgi:putative sterol carrier protein